MTSIRSRSTRRRTFKLWFERLMVAIATANLLLVFFDLSYIRFRDQYLRVLPQPTTWYGETFKGIEPHRVTAAYLENVDKLQAILEAEGLESPAAEQQLRVLQESSVTIVDEDPFAVANKSGTLERIKQAIRDRTGQENSSKDAFRTFWSQAYLQQGWSEELDFFDTQIRPRIETNYWRGIGFNGLPLDRFWLIDLPFIALFAAEFLARTLYLSRRHANTTWLDAMLWRLYDVTLLLPFWRWLRVIPVVIRSNQAQLSHLDPIQGRINRILISQFAVELTEVVFLRMIDQAQNLIKEGQISRWVFELTSQQGYIDLNDVNEVETIAQKISDIVVNKVLPEIKPDIDAVLSHTVTGALAQAPAYQGLKLLPGFTNISTQITQQISAEVSKNLYSALQQALADEQGAALMTKLIDSFGKNLRNEMRQGNTLDELQTLLDDLLEEVKVNYVERIAEHDVETRRADTYRLYSTTQKARPTPAKIVGR
ncbi:hypothetical protein IQ260_08285 [Leptolyngbya cf. ectocarpi LEGE 11479]|uniref:Uncharacterized protein n=1 Tax=Leptolyngbya cf. ectocarpi LEGE 11479 TaxID=1828722 RepID=A0A928X2G9_LEPEC|nr:hypothetical protein [Leptolyngbya ectocarpi]MBE9066650.1 hypothetical protein [Leptolyngbya cf. ectocarpi LEGE 11479]